MTHMTEKERLRFERRMLKATNEQSFKANLSRARSITVGTSFGGVTEVIMKKHDGDIIWATLQPVEVIELIHQLAANVGCHIHIQPRKDFASWRNWKHSEEELQHFRGDLNAQGSGWPPHAKSDGDEQYKSHLPSPEQQPGLKHSLMAKDKQNETMAIEKPKNRRNTKRTTAAT